MIVDDVDRRDQDSISVLAFVGRRLSTTRAGLLLSTRPSVAGGLHRHGLPELEVGPLTAEGSAELVNARFPDLAQGVAERVLADARGCPRDRRAAAALTTRQRRGVDPLPTVLPLSDRLSAVYEESLHGLGAPTSSFSSWQRWRGRATWRRCWPPDPLLLDSGSRGWTVPGARQP